MIIPFGEFSPDLPDFNNPGAMVATNVRPFFTGYRPFPDMGSAVSDALTTRARGAVSVVGDDSTVYTFAADTTTLNLLQDQVWVDASISGGYTIAAEEQIEFEFFNNKVIAASISNQLQGLNVGVDTTFSNLVDGTLRPSARHVAVIGQFVVIGNLEENSVRYPNRMRWSGIDDETDFDQSASTLSDFQDIEGSHGWIQGLVGGQRQGIIIFERGIFRMPFVGPPEVFAILSVEKNRGALAANSIVAWGQDVYFLDSDGFYKFNGEVAVPIGHGKVNQYFFDRWDATYKHRMVGTIDPVNSLVLWSYVSTSATGTDPDPDNVIAFHWPSGRWSNVELDHEMLFTGLTAPNTLESMDSIAASIENIPFSLDSIVYAGGTAQIAGFDTSHQMKFFDGSNLAATLETGLISLHAPSRSFVKGFRPHVDGGTITGAVAGVERLNDTASFGSAVSQQTTGIIPVKNKARHQKFRVSVAAAGTWSHAQGIEPDSVNAGMSV